MISKSLSILFTAAAFLGCATGANDTSSDGEDIHATATAKDMIASGFSAGAPSVPLAQIGEVKRFGVAGANDPDAITGEKGTLTPDKAFQMYTVSSRCGTGGPDQGAYLFVVKSKDFQPVLRVVGIADGHDARSASARLTKDDFVADPKEKKGDEWTISRGLWIVDAMHPQILVAVTSADDASAKNGKFATTGTYEIAVIDVSGTNGACGS